jgi:hypothetical protein
MVKKIAADKGTVTKGSHVLKDTFRHLKNQLASTTPPTDQ